jgi:hypothetical protein
MALLTGIFLLLCAVLYLDLRHFLEKDLRETQSRRARQIANTLLVHVKQTGEPSLGAARLRPAWCQPDYDCAGIPYA